MTRSKRSVIAVSTLVLVGAVTFSVGDWLLDRRGGSARKDPGGAQAEGAPLAIVLGSVLDGVPESFVLGLTVLQGGVSIPLPRPAFAGGALLAMLADTLLPEAYAVEGVVTGPLVAIGFAISIGLSAIE